MVGTELDSHFGKQFQPNQIETFTPSAPVVRWQWDPPTTCCDWGWNWWGLPLACACKLIPATKTCHTMWHAARSLHKQPSEGSGDAYLIVLVPTTPYEFQQLDGGGVVFCVHIGKYSQSICSLLPCRD